MFNHGNMHKHDSFLGADFKFRYTVELFDLIIFQNLGLRLQCNHWEYTICELKNLAILSLRFFY